MQHNNNTHLSHTTSFSLLLLDWHHLYMKHFLPDLYVPLSFLSFGPPMCSLIFPLQNTPDKLDFDFSYDNFRRCKEYFRKYWGRGRLYNLCWKTSNSIQNYTFEIIVYENLKIMVMVNLVLSQGNNFEYWVW